MKDIVKLYAAFKAGFLGHNILDTYFSFFANIIVNNQISIIEDKDIAEKFNNQYDIELSLPFVRQVLGVGVENHSIINDHGKYVAVMDEMKKFQFDKTDFDSRWNKLIDAFKKHCTSLGIDIEEINVDEFVLRIIDDSNYIFDPSEKITQDQGVDPLDYAWYSFVKNEAINESEMYTFIACLSLCNITNQSLFYTGDQVSDFSKLHVYLDSPIIFALLGMDETSRTQSYKTLLKDMQALNCSVHVLDHNFTEIEGIINSASVWATSTQYDMRKANNVARFFHDSEFTEEELTEFCGNIESKLNELGITKIETNYDILEDRFQEDEETLFEMIKTKYQEDGYRLLEEKEQTVRIDVRSIIMLYRKRNGQVAIRIENTGHIMLTSNNTIANVSKKYESNKSSQSGHIPACISVDLFGAIVWLNKPMKLVEYQKHRLLADCYHFLNPSKEMLDKYMTSLEEALNAAEIDEKKFLFLRTHPVVRESLMNITRGDYARFNSSTYKEVYEDIEARSLKKYHDESEAHNTTKRELQEAREESAREKEQSDNTIRDLQEKVAILEKEKVQEKQRRFDKKVRIWGVISTILFATIPYVMFTVLIEIGKTVYINITGSSSLTLTVIAYIAIFAILTIVLGALYKKIVSLCFDTVKKILTTRMNKKDI